MIGVRAHVTFEDVFRLRVLLAANCDLHPPGIHGYRQQHRQLLEESRQRQIGR